LLHVLFHPEESGFKFLRNFGGFLTKGWHIALLERYKTNEEKGREEGRGQSREKIWNKKENKKEYERKKQREYRWENKEKSKRAEKIIW
jgi:hypothetical protein